MWWRFITACLILAAIIVGGVFLLSYTTGLCNRIIDDVALSVQNVKSHGSDDGVALARAAQAWDASLPLICTLVIHAQADNVSLAFDRARAFLCGQSWDEYLAALGELVFYITLVRDYDRPTVRSLL